MSCDCRILLILSRAVLQNLWKYCRRGALREEVLGIVFLALGSDDLFFLIRQTSISCLSIIIFHWVGDNFFLMLFHSIAEFKCAIELCSTDQVKKLNSSMYCHLLFYHNQSPNVMTRFIILYQVYFGCKRF